MIDAFDICVYEYESLNEPIFTKMAAMRGRNFSISIVNASGLQVYYSSSHVTLAVPNTYKLIQVRLNKTGAYIVLG